ncbi:hypothetical protein [Methylocystis heyeri]|uniref:Uncharacterized protein n=1 Tax=Methylocystis heyeri TaxID=391905 RepID=A0A6B8KMD9_9HYPH|nr:hypothetical protein [Methylocystis heyeri]QGM48325.1 hypothetical protein H2LOC_021270 [Methylocystis heyeri]
MAHQPALPEIIDGKAVQSLVEAHAIRGATVLGQKGGWAVLVRYGVLERAVAAQRARKPRLWRNLATAAAFVRDELGLARFEVDAQAHEPDPGARRRPDQAARLRQQREAAEHDRWFRAEVQKTLDRIDAGEIGVIDEDAWAQRSAAKRAELARRAAATGG